MKIPILIALFNHINSSKFWEQIALLKRLKPGSWIVAILQEAYSCIYTCMVIPWPVGIGSKAVEDILLYLRNVIAA